MGRTWFALATALLVWVGCANLNQPLPVPCTKETILQSDAPCVIESWFCCGPFDLSGCQAILSRWAVPNSNLRMLESSLPIERYPAEGSQAQWIATKLVVTSADSTDPLTGKIQSLPVQMIDFAKLYAPRTVNRCAYALAFVRVPATVDRLLAIGSDDGVRIWLNGSLIDQFSGQRPLIPDEDTTIARFHTGLNALLVEVTNHAGYWGFSLRVRGPRETLPSALPIKIF